MKKIKLTEKNYHPIGSFFITESKESPSSLFGGTWERLPEGYALWTATSSAGGTIAAGLPNIKGYLSRAGLSYSEIQESGALKLTNVSKEHRVVASATDVLFLNNNINFDASKSNAIYGKSTTVQPPAYKAYVWKRVA